MVCIVCIVLKDRKTFIQKMLHESAGAKPGRGRAKARVAVVETEGVRPAQLRRLEEPGQPKTYLENCTGRDKTKTANDLFQPVLGDRLFAKNWHWFVFPKGSMSIDQANKSAGWMPGH